MNNLNNLGISMRNSADIQAHSFNIIKDNQVVSLEDYVNQVVSDNGGGGGGGDLTNYYDKTETDNLLNNKLNVNNPQNMEGTLTIGSVGGASKIIVNALSSTKDFYVNGDAQVLGNHLVQSLDSTSYIKGTNLISNIINADNLNDIFFQSNGTNYLQLDVSENKLVSSKLIQCGGNLTTQEIDTIAPLDLVIKRNGVDYITLSDGQINFNQPTNISVDTTNLVKKTGETDQKIDGTVSVNGDTVAGYELTVAGQVHTQGMYVASDADLIFGDPTRYITNPFGTAHIRHYTNGEHQFYCNGVEDFLIDQTKALARGNMLCVGQFQGSIFNSFNNNTVDVSFRKANVELMKLGGAKVMAYFPLGVASNIYDSVDNTDVVFKRNFVDFFFLRNNSVELSSGISLSTSSAKIDTIDTVGDNDLAFKRNNDSYMSFSQAVGKIFLQKDTEIQGDVNFIANKTIQIDNLNTVGDNDFVFKRSANNVMKLNTSNQLEFMGGNSKSVIYEDTYFDLATFNVLRIRNTETSDNRIISFGVGATLDVLQITDSGISSAVEMTSTQFLSNSYNGNGNNDVIFNRNGDEFFRLQTGTTDVINVEDSKGLTANYLFCNQLITRSLGADMIFKGYNTDNTARLEFMRHRKTNQDIQLSQPLFMNRQKLEFHKVASKEVFIDNFLESTVEILQLRNNDTTGQIRCVVGGNNIMDMSLSELNIYQDAEVANGKTLTATVVAHSDKKLKYDIKNIDNNFSNIVKSIEPKTFKIIREKELGIYKNHIGFIAQDVEEHISDDFENIVSKGKDGMKKLNYVNMNCITWGAVRELIEENKKLKSKVEHLESRLFEVENFIKDYINDKPKPKSKSKAKAKTNVVDF